VLFRFRSKNGHVQSFSSAIADVFFTADSSYYLSLSHTFFISVSPLYFSLSVLFSSLFGGLTVAFSRLWQGPKVPHFYFFDLLLLPKHQRPHFESEKNFKRNYQTRLRKFCNWNQDVQELAIPNS
jgi:hypothetical protein